MRNSCSNVDGRSVGSVAVSDVGQRGALGLGEVEDVRDPETAQDLRPCPRPFGVPAAGFPTDLVPVTVAGAAAGTDWSLCCSVRMSSGW
jgi:hypothetical protein